MRKSREETAESRARIVQTAAQLFRKGGLAATSIADVMAAAGMTHGGFYKHFSSKDALERDAVRIAFADLSKLYHASQTKGGPDHAKSTYIETYLSDRHIMHPEKGCPVAALGAEGARATQAVKDEFATGMEDMISRFVASGKEARNKQARADAIRQLALMVGSVVIARCCGDKKLADEVLMAVRDELA